LNTVEEGLDFILSHFEYPEHYFPRTISTKNTHNAQVLIYSKNEAMKYFIESKFMDCRISAYGLYEQEQIISNLIFVDLDDRCALNEVIILFHKTIGGKPTIIHTGNGYAILQPIKIKSWRGVVGGDKKEYDLAKLFLLWIERYLTNHKCDLANHPSLYNTMIRIPGTFNSKLLDQENSNDESLVCVVNCWDTIRVGIESVGSPFKEYVNQINKREQRRKENCKKVNLKNFKWLEKLLKQQITDGRQRLLFDTSRYLINIKSLTIKDGADKIDKWLDSSFYSRSTITKECEKALRDGFYPRRIETIQEGDPDLYHIISRSILL
jgi:hypothetical protein